MKRILAALTGALICGHVAAAPNWVLYTKTPTVDWYIDGNSVKAAGANDYSVWMKQVVTSANPAFLRGVSEAVLTAMGNVARRV